MKILCKSNIRKKSKEELVDELYEKYLEVEKLKRELEKYKNPNTPSSSNKHLKRNTQGLQAKRNSKRGAPKGHKGVTRQ